MKTKFCVACGSTEDLHSHHLIPTSLGGTDYETNLITLCFGCHDKIHQIEKNYGEISHINLVKLGMEKREKELKELGVWDKNWNNTVKNPKYKELMRQTKIKEKEVKKRIQKKIEESTEQIAKDLKNIVLDLYDTFQIKYGTQPTIRDVAAHLNNLGKRTVADKLWTITSTYKLLGRQGFAVNKNTKQKSKK